MGVGGLETEIGDCFLGFGFWGCWLGVGCWVMVVAVVMVLVVWCLVLGGLVLGLES